MQRSGGMHDQARSLTPSELDRLENLERLEREYGQNGFSSKLLTISIVDANKASLLLSGVPAVLLIVLFLLVRGSTVALEPFQILVAAAVCLVLIPVHEGLHGITWAAFAPGHLESIRFGFVKEYLTPYCTCLDPLSRKTYLAGVLMPFVALGIVPCLVGTAVGSWTVLLAGVFMLWGAGGDLAVAGKVLTYPNKSQKQVFLDHPVEIGLIVFER